MYFNDFIKAKQLWMTIMAYLVATEIDFELRTHRLCSKFDLLCYAALLKNFTNCVQIMLIDIEQFSDIYSSIPMFCR